MGKQNNNKEQPSVLCVILGGGRGSRLYPLTKNRAKPAVPLLGQYRLIDIPISNCLNSGFERIYVLTQFNSQSLLRHIANTYKFDIFSEGWVQVLPAQQTLKDSHWYQGTADAVRQNLPFITSQGPKYTLILSGDQLYRMDFRRLVRSHIESHADATVCCKPVFREDTKTFGILSRDRSGLVRDFVEKPDLDELSPKFIDTVLKEKQKNGQTGVYLASLGIYIFNTDILVEALNRMNKCDDFGSEIFPHCAQEYSFNTDVFYGYWQDVGTIRHFYKANLSFASHEPGFEIHAENSPIYTHPRFLPLPVIKNCNINRSIIGSGSNIAGKNIFQSVIGLRTRIGENVEVKRSIIMGADFMSNSRRHKNAFGSELPPVGIGSDCVLENCIIDKNASIGNNVRIPQNGDRKDEDNALYSVRDGIVVIPKNAVIPPGMVI